MMQMMSNNQSNLNINMSKLNYMNNENSSDSASNKSNSRVLKAAVIPDAINPGGISLMNKSNSNHSV
jgi:hypothetical protein